jgi:hypothetical protein
VSGRGPDCGEVLRRCGGRPRAAVTRGGPGRERELLSVANGYRPAVRLVDAGGWTVGIETFSSEGIRVPLVRRVSAGTRALSLLREHSVFLEWRVAFRNWAALQRSNLTIIKISAGSANPTPTMPDRLAEGDSDAHE